MKLDAKTRQKIRQAFQAGELKTRSVNTVTGVVFDAPISDVLKHPSEHKQCLRITLTDGRSAVVTEDHSLFYRRGAGVEPVKAGDLTAKDLIVVATLEAGVAGVAEVAGVLPVPVRLYTYDLSVPGSQNFLLENGILAHNSYSIGGISLDIDRSSKYESLASKAEARFHDSGMDIKKRTTLFQRGLSQPRFGAGVRSAFGPHVGKGVLSPRGFLVLTWCLILGRLAWEVINYANQMPLL